MQLQVEVWYEEYVLALTLLQTHIPLYRSKNSELLLLLLPAVQYSNSLLRRHWDWPETRAAPTLSRDAIASLLPCRAGPTNNDDITPVHTPPLAHTTHTLISVVYHQHRRHGWLESQGCV